MFSRCSPQKTYVIALISSTLARCFWWVPQHVCRRYSLEYYFCGVASFIWNLWLSPCFLFPATIVAGHYGFTLVVHLSFFFWFGFYGPFKNISLYGADRSSKVGENRRTQGKTTWPYPQAELGFPTWDLALLSTRQQGACPICPSYSHPYFYFWMITWMNVNGFSPNLVCALILQKCSSYGPLPKLL